MRTIRRILVAVKDPQSKSLPAVAKATQLARALGAHVELFHDLNTPIYIDTAGPTEEGYSGMMREQRARRLSQLETLASRVRKHGVKVSVAAEWDFPAYEAIVRRATRTGADLIVVGCRTGHRFAPLLLRLTDWELLRFSPVPVLLVKNTRPYRRPVVLAAVDPGHAHAKTSRLDEEILNTAAAIQSALRGSLHAVHAFMPTPVGATSSDLLNGDVLVRMQKDLETAATARFDRALRKMNIPSARRHLIGRHPQDAIEQAVRETHSALVVMGAVSRSGLKRIFIGNTAESVLDDLPCDVLIVKPTKFANRVPRAKRGANLIVPQPMMPSGLY